MKQFLQLTILGFSIFMLTGCGGRIEVSDLFKMEGCSGPCYQRMPCEGQSVTLEVELTGSNVLKNGRMFFVRDENEPMHTIKVEFDESIPEDVLQRMVDNIGQTAVLEGHIEGYDLLNPESCRRAHLIYISGQEDVSFE